MKKQWTAPVVAALVALTVGAATLLGERGGEPPLQRKSPDSAALPSDAEVAELSRAAIVGIAKEGLRISVLSDAESEKIEGIVPRQTVVGDVLAGATGRYDAPELTEVSLARVTDPGFGSSRGDVDDPNAPVDLELEIKDRLMWVVTSHKVDVPMMLSGPAPKSEEEAKGREEAPPVVFDKASYVVLLDAFSGKFVRAESITVADR